jgi:hypothetical protein
LRTSPCPNPYRRRAAPLLACVALCAAVLSGQELQRLPAPPDFSQQAIAARADEVMSAWERWGRADRKLEQRIFALPMSEAREQLRLSLGAFLDFLAARGAYAESVAAYLGRGGSANSFPIVTEDAGCRDRIGLLGASLAALQEKLVSLRNSSMWLTVRRGVQEQNDQALKLQSTLRERLDTAPRNPQPAANTAALSYRDSERLLAETLRRLWTAYYQALADAVERKSTAPLTPVQRPDSAHPGDPTARSADSPQEEVWTYTEGSQQFNGVAEPKRVLLELWTENGVLFGRYRAELPDFHGTKTVDVRLRGVPSSAGAQTLRIESEDPAPAGQIVLERSGLIGELMLVRVVPARGAIPRGREVLRRR